MIEEDLQNKTVASKSPDFIPDETEMDPTVNIVIPPPDNDEIKDETELKDTLTDEENNLQGVRDSINDRLTSSVAPQTVEPSPAA